MGQKNILVVEDESIIAYVIKETLINLGYFVTDIVNTGEECLRKIEEKIPDIILMDIRLSGDLDGIETAEIIHNKYGIPIIFVTAHSDNRLLQDAKKTEPYAYILKPINNMELHHAIEIALYKFNLDKNLKESEAMLRKTEEIAHIGTYIYNLSTNTVRWSRELLNIFSLDTENVNRPFEDSLSSIHPEDLSNVVTAARSSIENKKPYEIEYRIIHPDQSIHYILARGDLNCDKNGKVIEVVGTAQDITDQKRSEDRIMHLNSLLRVIRIINQLNTNEKDVSRLIQNTCRNIIKTNYYISAFIILLDKNNNYLTAESAGFDTNYSSRLKKYNKALPCVLKAMNQNDLVLINKNYDICGKCPLHNAGLETEKMLITLEFGKKNYGVLSVQMNTPFSLDEDERFLINELAVDIAYALYSIEIEKDRKNLIDQLVHSEKLSAVGQLAAGLVHEFNNFLNVILGRTQIAMFDDSIDDIKDTLKVIENVTKRGSDLVKNLGVFARPQKPKLEMHDITESINAVIKFQKKQLALENIKIEKNYIKKPGILFDKGQFEQVFLNLLINASHAIRPKGEGIITITVNEEDNFIQIWFSDTGIGMDETIRNHIFDPFFTTKKSRNNNDISGSGLGLSVTQSIIEQHNGAISVESKKGEGTTFIIKLPRVFEESVNEKKSVTGMPGAEMEKLKDTRIMVIDDEKEMIDLMGYVFKKSGFKNVIIKERAQEAISIFRSFNPDIVFLDLVMPDTNGELVFKELKAIDKSVPIVFMSGKVSIDEEKLLNMGAYDFIHKPFDVKVIFDVIRELRL